jgi:hypothetical protein
MRLVHISMTLIALIPAFADTHTLDEEKGSAIIQSELKNGIDLPAVSTVHDSVGVTAVLPQPLISKSKLVSPTEANLELPADAKTSNWTVQVLQDTVVKATVKLK